MKACPLEIRMPPELKGDIQATRGGTRSGRFGKFHEVSAKGQDRVHMYGMKKNGSRNAQ